MREYGRDQSRLKVSHDFAALTFFSVSGCYERPHIADSAELWEEFPREGAVRFFKTNPYSMYVMYVGTWTSSDIAWSSGHC